MERKVIKGLGFRVRGLGLTVVLVENVRDVAARAKPSGALVCCKTNHAR